jgi:hypothetical protein
MRFRLVLLALAFSAPARADYLFTYFTGNGEDGLHLAASTDGYRWEKLNRGASYLAPRVGQSRLMRDPCVVRGPDGSYHLVWTSGWNENNIGYAATRDFITWSEEKEIPVMAHEAQVRNCWAPEVAYDEKRGEFIIIWASTIRGKFAQTAGTSEDAYNHRMYCTTTKDFATFSPTRLFYDPGFSVIDATFLRARGQYYLIIKDESRTPPKKYLQMAAAPDMRGPFGPLSAPLTPAGLWVEGPTTVQIGADYVIYYDAYQTHHYGAIRSRDLKTWEDVTSRLVMPDEGTPRRMRHGTIIEVPAALCTALRERSSAGGPAP